MIFMYENVHVYFTFSTFLKMTILGKKLHVLHLKMKKTDRIRNILSA